MGFTAAGRYTSRMTIRRFSFVASVLMLVAAAVWVRADDVRIEVPSTDQSPSTAPSASQTPSTGPTGTIVGVAVDAKGTGMPRTTVDVWTTDTVPQRLAHAETDGQGHFELDDVPAGDNLTVTVAHRGDTMMTFGKKTGVNVKLGESVDVGNIELTGN